MPGYKAHRRWNRRADANMPEARRLIMAGQTPLEVSTALGCSIETVYRIRRELREAGEDVPACHRGVGATNNVYDRRFDDADDLSGERCRCGLRLPCNACLPTLTEVALSRVGAPAGQAYVGGRISEGGSRRSTKAL
jgi:hypothetical protein